MGNSKKDDKEIPTITSLLKRRKLRSGPDALDRSKPMDLSALEKEFAPVEDAHPTIEGIDNWDTRGIARQVKHNEAAKKSDEFKALLEKKAMKAAEDERTDRRRRERSISISVKINKQQQPVIVHGHQPETKPTPSASKSAVKPVAPRAPQAPVTPIKSSTRPVAVAPTAPQAPRTGNPKSVPVQATPRGVSNTRPLATWTMEMLKGGPDPLGKGLSILLERGAVTALFLSIAPPPPGAKIPHFAAAAAAKPDRDKLAIWQGLRWDPASVPQVWNQLLKSGYIEFHPPGNVTHIGSSRNTIRAAFGLGNEQILLLIRVGPVSACRGVLAVLSDRSLLIELGPILTLFNTPLPLQKTG